jgi:hypothetical protein
MPRDVPESSAASGFTISTKKTNDRQKSRTILGGYSPGDIRVRHHPLKHFDIASLLLCSIKEIDSLPLEVSVINLKL